jgi:hypothetical protein
MPRRLGSIAAFVTPTLALGLTILAAVPAVAQSSEQRPPIEFIPRYDFRMYAAALAHEDQRFAWDTHWVGDFDLLDYGYGRMSFLADYQAVLGDEFRPFDPYQSNYTLAVAGSVRRGPTEFIGVFHHVSRHLGDRPKRDAVAMNAVVGRVARRFALNGSTLDVRGGLGRVVARAYVDYTWIADVEALVRRTVSPRVGLYGRAAGELYRVDRAIAGRDQQQGGRIEAGVRLDGGAGAMELFGGYERVVDADPLDRQFRHWAFAGFRLLNR